MTTKVRIKNEEQVNKRKRKRVETEKVKKKKKALNNLKSSINEVRKLDKETEAEWSKIDIENERELMAMGLAGLEVMEDPQIEIVRAGKRKKTTPQKDKSKVKKKKSNKAGNGECKSQSGDKSSSNENSIPISIDNTSPVNNDSTPPTSNEDPSPSNNNTPSPNSNETLSSSNKESQPEESSADKSVTMTPEERQKGERWIRLDVCDEIVKALVELNFTTPTPIQEQCIPAGLLKYKDVIGAAETGSGKTLAFGIPLMQRVMKMKTGGVLKGLVLCPTRELALQVSDHLKAAARYTNLTIVPLVGGMAVAKQQRLLGYHPQIVVATPGRFWQLLQDTPYLQDLSSLRFLVVDEADRMVEDGHFKEVTDIVGRIPTPMQRNTFLFSATLAFTIDKLDQKAKKTQKKTKQEKKMAKKFGGLEMLVKNIGIRDKVEKVDFTQKRGTTENLKETYLLSNVEDKDLHLYYLLLSHPGKILVFVNSIDNVMNLVNIMELLELPVLPLHSSLQQRQRLKFLDRFKDSDVCTMVCTDVAARGLDIPHVDTVIHYQLPRSKEAYIHRSGRTARASNEGLSIAIVGPKDFKSYKSISSQMTEFPIEMGRLRALREALSLARRIFRLDRLKSRPLLREERLVALAREAGLEPDAGDVGQSSVELVKSNKQQVKKLKFELRQVLRQPVISPLNSSRYISSSGSVEFQNLKKFNLGRTALKHCTKR